MVSFSEAVNQQLCKIASTLDKILKVDETREKRDTDIVFITIPEDATPSAGTRSFAVGTTKIDFRTGVIENPDGTLEYLNTKLNTYHLDWLHSLSVDTNHDITIKLEGKPKRTISAEFSTQIPYLTYYTLEITCSVITNIQVFACTNPAAILGQFKQTTITVYEQESVNGDLIEAQTWDAVVNLKHNLNRIRNQIIAITGEAWGTVSHSIAAIWAKFHATTGHAHSGVADGGAQVDHVNVANKGTNTHAQIDAYIAAGNINIFKYRKASRYHTSCPIPSYGGYTSLSSNRLYAVPFVVMDAITVLRMAIHVHAGAAGLARLGIYTDNSSLFPDALVVDAGEVDVSTTGVKEITGMNITLNANTLYWLVVETNVVLQLKSVALDFQWNLLGNPTTDLTYSYGVWRTDFTYAALPATFPSDATTSQSTVYSKIGVYF